MFSTGRSPVSTPTAFVSVPLAFTILFSKASSFFASEHFTSSELTCLPFTVRTGFRSMAQPELSPPRAMTRVSFPITVNLSTLPAREGVGETASKSMATKTATREQRMGTLLDCRRGPECSTRIKRIASCQRVPRLSFCCRIREITFHESRRPRYNLLRNPQPRLAVKEHRHGYRH